MITVQIRDKNNKARVVINNIFNLQIDDEVNKGGKLKLRFPTEDRLQKEPIQKGERISIDYGESIGNIIRIFDGYITDVTLWTTECQIEADNRLSYLQYRIIRRQKTYTNAKIKNVIQEIYNELNTHGVLPFTLGKNDCETTISKTFDTGTSFFDILKYCFQGEAELVFRILYSPEGDQLEVGKNVGKILDGVREYDANYTRGTNITDWSRKDSMDNFYSYIKTASGEVTNETFIERTWLLFEKYEEQGSLMLPSWVAIPSISVSRDTDWWNFDIGDRKEVRLETWYEWLPLTYLGLIQKRKITVDSTWGIKAEIKISESYKEDTNILDLLFQNLKQK